MPDEIAELRELLETAMGVLAAAEDDAEAAAAELELARDAERSANDRLESAAQAEEATRRRYVDALKRHGFVRTAAGPIPAGVAEVMATHGCDRAAAEAMIGQAADAASMAFAAERLAAAARPLAHSGLWPNPPAVVDASQLAIWGVTPARDGGTYGSGPLAGKATGTGGQVEIQCCGVWIDYPTPGNDTSCGECGSTFTVEASQLAVIGASGDAIPVATAAAPARHHLYERLEGDRPGAPCRVDGCGQPKSAEVHQVRA